MLEKVWRKRSTLTLMVERQTGTATMENSVEFLKKTGNRDFPGGPVVKNLPSNAGDAGSIPGQETKIPHAEEQLSPSTFNS